MNIAEAEAILAASPDHRVLRRVPPSSEWRLNPQKGETRRALFVDVETTGLDQDSDEVIELALLPFEYLRETGEVTSVDEANALCEFREPSFPIPAPSTLIHGLTDADVRGKVVDEKRVKALVQDVQLIIAHNAAFDRPMVEKHWPIFERKHWACSLAEIDWKAEGLGSGKLDYLLLKLGWFHDAHRALGDALAATFLLTQRLPILKQPALQVLLECARRPLKAVRAEETAFSQRAALKQRGYRWDAGNSAREKAWWVLTEDPDAEVAWLNSAIYAKPRDITVLNMPATRRYSSRIWS